jgi:hypothetical protein
VGGEAIFEVSLMNFMHPVFHCFSAVFDARKAVAAGVRFSPFCPLVMEGERRLRSSEEARGEWHLMPVGLVLEKAE